MNVFTFLCDLIVGLYGLWTSVFPSLPSTGRRRSSQRDRGAGEEGGGMLEVEHLTAELVGLSINEGQLGGCRGQGLRERGDRRVKTEDEERGRSVAVERRRREKVEEGRLWK
ncbi:uncharacterized protein J3R85_002187 [Psidium guajava]|nr:uncharacterized protein J3R85_002187 [Psidium guajava]